MKRYVLAVVCCLALGGQVLAQSSERFEARTLIEGFGIAEHTDGAVRELRDALITHMRDDPDNRGRPEEGIRDFIDEVVMPEFRVRLDVLTENFVSIYLANFSIEELREINRFYSSPLGRKMIEVMPSMAASFDIAKADWIRRMSGDVFAAVVSRLKTSTDNHMSYWRERLRSREGSR